MNECIGCCSYVVCIGAVVVGIVFVCSYDCVD